MLSSLLGYGEDMLEAMGDEEKKKMDDFSERLKEKKVKLDESHALNETTYLRFLVANNFDMDKAEAQFDAAVKWRADAKPEEANPKECSVAIKQGMMRFCGHGRNGSMILKGSSALWQPSEYTVEEFERMILYFLEKAIKQAKGNYQFVVLIDMADWGLQNWNMQMIYSAVTILQQYYPERLSKALLVNTPWIFNATWAIIKGWLNPRTASKVCFIGQEDTKTLFEYIDKDVLEKKYGGDHDAYPVGE